MADSSYYYNLYKQRKNEASSYERNLKDLRKAHDNLADTMDDEIRGVNNELEDLKEDLNEGIRHNSQFTSRANQVTAEKEKSVTADSNLSVAVRGLEDEISRIEGLKNTAANERDYYYDRYKEKKEEERQEFFKNLF